MDASLSYKFFQNRAKSGHYSDFQEYKPKTKKTSNI